MSRKIYCSYPQAQFQSHKEELLEAIYKVCEKGPYILGTEVESFENEFADYHDVSYCVCVGSGTDALALTLKAFGIRAGDEVITVSHTALATAAAIVISGATPVLVDIEEDFYTLDPQKIEACITSKTKAIIPVHLYGQPCDMDPILQIAQKHGLRIIEDCAQAHGAAYKGKKVGTLGDAGCFSFYPTKNLGAIGDGGSVITNNQALTERLKRLRQYGWDDARVSQEPGVVSRLDEIQAAILRVKLKFLNAANAERQRIAFFYNEHLKDSEYIVPVIRSGCSHVYHLYVIRAFNRNELKARLANEGIEAAIHYAIPVHQHPGFQGKIKISEEGLENTNKIISEILTLPIYPELDEQNLTSICKVLKNV
jgi:dTDP-4-amino-4,6-dideoxygalactose transaminase